MWGHTPLFVIDFPGSLRRMAVQTQSFLVERDRASVIYGTDNSLGELHQGIFPCEESSKDSCERYRSLLSFSPPFLSGLGCSHFRCQGCSYSPTQNLCPTQVAKPFHQSQQRTGPHHRHLHDEWGLMFPTTGQLSLLHLQMGPAQLCSSIYTIST